MATASASAVHAFAVHCARNGEPASVGVTTAPVLRLSRILLAQEIVGLVGGVEVDSEVRGECSDGRQ